MEERGEGSGPGGGAASESRGRPFRKTLRRKAHSGVGEVKERGEGRGISTAG